MPQRTYCLSALLLFGCVGDSDPEVAGEGEAEGEDPCGEEKMASYRRYGIMPNGCPGTSTPCSTPQAPTGCNVRPGALACTTPPGPATVFEVCGACTYTTIAAAVGAIPANPGAEHWVVVHAGTYSENVTVTQTSDAGDPITIAARCVGGSRDAVAIQASTNDPVLKVSSSSHNVTLEGFRVLASSTSSGAGEEGAVMLLGNNADVRDIVVQGATAQAAFYVEGDGCEFDEVDTIDCKYGLQTWSADNVDLERGAFCGSLTAGILIDGGSGFVANATLTRNSTEAGVRVGEATSAANTRFKRLLTTGHRAPAGFGIDLWDAAGFELWHSQVTDNSFGLSIDLGATDVDVENSLFNRFGTGIVVQGGYTASDQLRARFSTFADGNAAIDANAVLDIRLDHNIFFAGSAPGGYGIDATSAAATLSAWDGSAVPLENLFYGNYGTNQACADGGSGECTNAIAFTGDPFIHGNGYYLEEDLSAAVNAAGSNANTVTLGDGTNVGDYTTSLDLNLDGGLADLGFHHPPCFETVGDLGCGDGYCAGAETSGSCPRDCL